MKIEDNHAHAITYYEQTSFKHFLALFISIVRTKFKKYLSLTVHLPLEIQHPDIFKNSMIGKFFIHYGEFLKKIFNVKLYWENSPLLEQGTWKLKYNQLNWNNIPKNINLCLDTGHLILGSINTPDAQRRILTFHKKFLKHIHHLHIHENDLVSDSHQKPSKIITKNILETITRGRTFIYEK